MMANLLFSFKRSYFSISVIHMRSSLNKFINPSQSSIYRTYSTSVCNYTKLKPVFKSLSFFPINKLLNSKTHQTTIWLSVKFYQPTPKNIRQFHTSESRHFHPVFWVILKPVLKLFAVLSGRGFRKWWKELPLNKKKYFINVVKENRNKITAFILTSIALSVIYYISHLEETPITKRRRFIAFNSKQLEKINEYELQQILDKIQGQIFPDHHPYSLRVKAVVNRIISANQDIKEVKQKKWDVAVINSSIENAFVLPIGYVFVFTGMLNVCSNDDQLGIILSHEMAHCIQNHGAENISVVHLLDLISIMIIAAIWAVLPSDSISLLTHWLYSKLTEILLQLPYNRKIETEADKVGLHLAAKACFDVRESSAFWSKMAFLNKAHNKMPQIEFLSTHPNHETRSEYLDSIMNEAIKLRAECGCPRLRYSDPRMEVEAITKLLEISRQKYLEQNPKPVHVFHH